jgi:short-subunit dehydrogenase
MNVSKRVAIVTGASRDGEVLARVLAERDYILIGARNPGPLHDVAESILRPERTWCPWPAT